MTRFVRKILLVVVLASIVALLLLPLFNNGLQYQHENSAGKHICTCALECMDGRTQLVVADTAKKVASADLVDVITQAGIVRILAENRNQALIENFKYELGISVEKHGTKIVSIVAHEDCAGNPVSKEQQMHNLRQAKKTVESWNMGVKVIMLWVEKPFNKAELVK